MLLDRQDVELGAAKMNERQFLPQQTGWDCFPIAVANSLIYLGCLGANLKQARKIAKCENGGTICPRAVVEFMRAPLSETWDAWDVVATGGIVSIMHPVYNGHAIFVFPQDGFRSYQFTVVNSLLGPTVYPNWTMPHLSPYLRTNFGPFWVIDRNSIHRSEYVA